MVTDSLSVVSLQSGDSSIPILLIISPYAIIALTIFLNWRFGEKKKYDEIESLQSYIIFLIRDNLEKIEKQIGFLEEFTKFDIFHNKNLILVASVNIQDIYRIPQPDVFAALVRIKDKSSSARNQY